MGYARDAHSLGAAMVYFGFEAGFSSVAGGVNDVAEKHRFFYFGLKIDDDSAHAGSFIEISPGTAKNQLFNDDEERLNVLARITLSKEGGVVFPLIRSVYAETEFDSSLDSGSDSVQTRIGFSINTSFY